MTSVWIALTMFVLLIIITGCGGLIIQKRKRNKEIRRFILESMDKDKTFPWTDFDLANRSGDHHFSWREIRRCLDGMWEDGLVSKTKGKMTGLGRESSIYTRIIKPTDLSRSHISQ